MINIQLNAKLNIISVFKMLGKFSYKYSSIETSSKAIPFP